MIKIAFFFICAIKKTYYKVWCYYKNKSIKDKARLIVLSSVKLTNIW